MKKSYEQLKQNTVKADAQLKKEQYVTYINPGGKGKRIMFAGNSMTLHGIKEDIGWYGEWGMAASSKENDYVHKIISMIEKIADDCSFCICHMSTWEKNYKNGSELLELFEDAKEFHADIIVMRFVENCPYEGFDSKQFKKELDSLLGYLSNRKDVKIIISTGFWRHPADETIIEYANENMLPLVELGDLGEMDEMKAIGLFEHSGVANHPGDIGMATIAKRIFDKLKCFFQ